MADELLDRFSEACGQVGPLMASLDGPGSPTPIEFPGPFFVVGRGDRADLGIDSPAISRRHAYFQVVAGRVFCVDLASRTGVHWGDGARRVGWVDPGRGVVVGPTRIRLAGQSAEHDGDGGHLPISRSFDWGHLPEARVEFMAGEADREPWQVSRSLVLLGRSSTCRVRLSGPGVGGIHAALLRTPSGVWIVDLLGPGGILVRGNPARCALLQDGDEVGMGGHRIRIRLGDAARPVVGTKLARIVGSRAVRPSVPETLPEMVRAEVDRARPASIDPLAARLLEEFDRMHQKTTEQFQQAILMMFRMHQDQMEVIRDGLLRLDRLEAEQRELQSDVARLEPARGHRPALRLVADGGVVPFGALPAQPASSGPPEPARPSGEAPGGDRPSPRDPADEADPHLQITLRIAEINSERQGLWRRLLASLSGDGSDKGVL